MREIRVCYFLGNIISHHDHAKPIYEKLNGQFITLSNKRNLELEKLNYNTYCVDDRPDLFLKFDRKITKTIKYIEENFDIVLFYEIFHFSSFAYIKKIPTVFLSHGNMLKEFMWKERLIALKKYSYLAGLSPYIKNQFISKYKISEEKILDIGNARNDLMFAVRNGRIPTNKIIEELNINIENKTISYIPTWWGTSTVNSIGIDLIESFPNEKYNLLIRLHPQTPESLVKEIHKRIDGRKNIFLVKNINLELQISVSSLLIADLSSIVLDWILTHKPIIFLYDLDNDYRKNLESIREIIESSAYLNKSNLKNIDEVLSNALVNKLPEETLEKVKIRAFYNYDGDSTNSIIDSIKQIFLKKIRSERKKTSLEKIKNLIKKIKLR